MVDETPTTGKNVERVRNTREKLIGITGNEHIRLIHPALERAGYDLVRCTGEERG